MQPSSRGSLHLVVMAGGSGTRFWPRSTRRRPKQLLTFGKGRLSLLGQTLARFDGLVAPDRRLVVTTEALRAAIEETKGYVGVSGVYNLTAEDHNGLGVDSLVMVQVTNSTPELDGSWHDYFIRVPPDVQTPRQAVAWTFGLEAEDYRPATET